MQNNKYLLNINNGGVAGQTNMSSPKAKKSLNPFDDDDDDDNVDVRDTFGMDKHKGDQKQ